MLLVLFAGVLVYLLGDGSFRRLARWLVRRLPILAVRDATSRLRPGQLSLALAAYAAWILGVGGVALMDIWNALAPPDLAITFGDAIFDLAFSAFLTWPLIFTLEILAFSAGRPDLAARLGVVPVPVGDVLPLPSTLEPALAAAMTVVRSCLRPLEGGVKAVVHRPGFIDDWLDLEAASLGLDVELRERTVARGLVAASSQEFATNARARLNALRMAAIEEDVFGGETIAAAERRRADRRGPEGAIVEAPSNS